MKGPLRRTAEGSTPSVLPEIDSTKATELYGAGQQMPKRLDIRDPSSDDDQPTVTSIQRQGKVLTVGI
jgi:hypothetical protein